MCRHVTGGLLLENIAEDPCFLASARIPSCCFCTYQVLNLFLIYPRADFADSCKPNVAVFRNQFPTLCGATHNKIGDGNLLAV